MGVTEIAPTELDQRIMGLHIAGSIRWFPSWATHQLTHHDPVPRTPSLTMPFVLANRDPLISFHVFLALPVYNFLEFPLFCPVSPQDFLHEYIFRPTLCGLIPHALYIDPKESRQTSSATKQVQMTREKG